MDSEQFQIEKLLRLRLSVSRSTRNARWVMPVPLYEPVTLQGLSPYTPVTALYAGCHCSAVPRGHSARPR